MRAQTDPERNLYGLVQATAVKGANSASALNVMRRAEPSHREQIVSLEIFLPRRLKLSEGTGK